ncbi:MAG: hypothetical protein PHE25_04610 [Candidatus Gracilibacteria bacterium]|nr:hypothetical protein [Candidatus Gracilibacteria bacterium]
MSDPKTLVDENLELKKQIEILNSKLNRVKIWMEREVREQAHKIAKSKTSKLTSAVKEDFLSENFEEVIASRINNYFGDLLLLNAPKGTIESITSAEINYYNMMKNPTIDGFAVISAYHKVLDLFIESFITNNFRKFAKKRGCTILRVNDPLEKALNLIVNSKYIMSTGRLYGLLKMLKEDAKMFDYGKCFKEYLDKYIELKNILLNDEFFNKFSRLNKSEVLGSKRHSGSISKKDTMDARKILIGDFRDKASMIYKILEGQSVIY